MNKPMPSPRGTNRENLTIGERVVVAAYDAEPELRSGSKAIDPPMDASALTDETGAPIADSASAHRILCSCIESLSRDDFDDVVKMLQEKGTLSDDEARAITSNLSGGEPGSEADMASDARVMQRRHEMVRNGTMSHADLYRPLPSKQSSPSDFHKRFPDAARIKHPTF